MKKHLIFFLTLIISLSTYAQAGYSSASLSMGKMRSDAMQCPTPEEVIVEEYMNYHRHSIPLPEKGKEVKLSAQWGNEHFNQYSSEGILQIGITTARDLNNEAPPVNVSLVIDKSGSMSGDRIHHAREAAKKFVQRLRDEDIISIVTFDHNISVLLPAQSAKNKTTILKAIDGIYPGGSTNLNDGLIRGYDEVVKNYTSKITNKVIMLTDALTNTGQINPEEIVKNSMGYTDDQEIDISVIGVGVNFNNSLARQLASSAKSSIHFIYNAADIQKVFVDEIESLLSPVGKEVKLKIEFEEGLVLDHFFGYQPSVSKNSIELDLDKMNSGLTQVFILKFKLDPKTIKTQNRVNIALSYKDAKSDKSVLLKEESTLSYIKNGLLQLPVLDDSIVRKNYTIAELAKGIKDMAVAMQRKNDMPSAQQIVRYNLDAAFQRFNGQFDGDVQRVYDILSRYGSQMLAMNKKD